LWFLNIQTSKQHGKNLAVDLGPTGGGGPSHGTTGTMVNPAWIANRVNSDMTVGLKLAKTA